MTAFAAESPALARSRMVSRSNSANEPKCSAINALEPVDVGVHQEGWGNQIYVFRESFYGG